MNRAFYGWLTAASLSGLGDAAVFFALGWAATGIGPGVAGLVVTAFTLPRALLLLVGGVVGDRLGPRRVVIAGHAVLCAATFALAAAVHLAGTSVALLVLTGLTIGIVDAFVLPAIGSLPRLFARDDELPRALALRGSTGQLVSLVGGPASAVLVAATGLTGALLVDGASFALVLTALVVIRPPYEATAGKESLDGQPSAVREAAEGLRLAWSEAVLRALLLAVALVGGFVLPVATLCVPLLVRAQGWDVTDAGLIVGASVGGSLLITLLVARYGSLRRPGQVAGVGSLVAAVGIAGLAVAPTAGTGTMCAAVQGIGIGLFTSHLAPLFVASTPRSHLARLQSILLLVQTVPLLVSMNLLGVVAVSGARRAVLVCALGTGCAGVTLLLVRKVRSAGSAPLTVTVE